MFFTHEILDMMLEILIVDLLLFLLCTKRVDVFTIQRSSLEKFKAIIYSASFYSYLKIQLFCKRDLIVRGLLSFL